MQAGAKVLTILLAVLLMAGLPIGAATCGWNFGGCTDKSMTQSPGCCAGLDCTCHLAAPRPPAPHPDDSAVTASGKIAVGDGVAPAAMTLAVSPGSLPLVARNSVSAALRDVPLYSLTHSFLI